MASNPDTPSTVASVGCCMMQRSITMQTLTPCALPGKKPGTSLDDEAAGLTLLQPSWKMDRSSSIKVEQRVLGCTDVCLHPCMYSICNSMFPGRQQATTSSKGAHRPQCRRARCVAPCRRQGRRPPPPPSPGARPLRRPHTPRWPVEGTPGQVWQPHPPTVAGRRPTPRRPRLERGAGQGRRQPPSSPRYKCAGCMQLLRLACKPAHEHAVSAKHAHTDDRWGEPQRGPRPRPPAADATGERWAERPPPPRRDRWDGEGSDFGTPPQADRWGAPVDRWGRTTHGPPGAQDTHQDTTSRAVA